MKSVIDISSLCKNYNTFAAVSNLSFTVQKGDIFGFLGQNGAGKSTTIRMLLTLIQPSSGSIRLFGDSLAEHRRDILQKVGAIIEKPDLYKYLSAIDNLNLFAKMSGLKLSNKTLMEQLDLVGLADRSTSKVKTFSQGMKQRLGIAVSLVHDPELIILDEPTNGLDPQGIAEVRNLIVQLSRERGKTILVSSHLLSEIEIIANRMLIIHKGEKIVEGLVNDLLDPSKTMVKLETTDNETAYKILEYSKWSEKIILHESHIQVETDKTDLPNLVRYLSDHKIDIYLVQPRHSLEDYFLNLTKTQ